MNPVKATFATAMQSFPVGTQAAGFLLTLTEQLAPVADGEIQPTPRVVTGRGHLDATEILIDDVPVGTYIGKIALVDSADEELAPAVVDLAPIVIADAQPLSLPVPSSLILTRP